MAGCDDTRQLTEAQRQAGYQGQRTGVPRAIRPFTGRPTIENLIDYINRELQPAVRQTRDRVNDIYLPVADNAPSANPLGFYFSTETANADPTTGRIRLNQATQDTATVIRVSETNGRLVDVAPWLDVMSGGVTSPLGVVTLADAVNPARFIRFDLSSMADAGTYWNLTVVPVESSHDNPFVEGGAVVISFIPGVGGVTPATIPPTAISGADGPRQFLSTSTGTTVDWRTLSAIFPGAPIYDVMAYPFNATGSLAGNDTSAINAAIAAANLVPGIICLGPAHRITAALTTVTGNNIQIVGRGPFNGGTILQVDSAGAIDAITIDGPQYCGISGVWFVGNRVYSGGFAIRIVDCFRAKLKNILISQLCFGVEILRSTLTEIERVFLDDLYGVYGFYAHGDATAENHAVKFINCVCGTDYNSTVVGDAGVWAAGQTIVAGNIRFSNGAIYQATTSGTTGATPPSGIPGATVATAHTATVSDGGVSWKFSMPLGSWFLQGSYSHTFEVLHCGTLQGGYGLSVEDDAPGVGSAPLFTRVSDLQVDHPFSRGIRLAAGAAARLGQVFVTSVLEGSGIEIGSAYSGNWEIIGGEVFGCHRAGVVIDKGDGVLSDVQIGSCGHIASNTRDCIEVAAGVSRVRITGCSGGSMFGSTSPPSRYGLSLGAGCDNYEVVGNVFVGNVTGGILNTPGRADTRVVEGNVPDTEIAVGSVWGLQIDHGASDVPREVTKFELGENLRRETVVVDSTSSGTSATYAIASTTTQVQFKLAGALTINGMTAAALTFGKLVVFSFDSGFAGSVTWNNESGSAGAALERVRTPGGVALTISAGETAVFEYFDSRWRCIAAGRANNLTDGDKGDITVSLSGTVWNIDANVVGDAELRQGIACSVIGRSANSTGNVADIQGGTNDRVLARASNALSFQQVSTAMIADSAVTDAKLRNGQGNSVIGRSVNSTGVVADIVCVAGTFGVLRENGSGTIAWGTITTDNITDAAVTLAKQANLAQSRVIGRAESAGTGVPTALTPTQIVSIIDGETVTWTGGHTFQGTNSYEGSNTFTGPARFNDQFRLMGVLSSASTAANNLAIGSVSVARFTAPIDPLTGMVAVADGQVVLLVNAHSASNMAIHLESASSTAANRFSGVGTSRIIKAGEMAIAWYDGSASRWSLLCRDDVDL